jgi:hypothetical protein
MHDDIHTTATAAISPLQRDLLTQAAARPDHAVLPLPAACRIFGGARIRLLTALLRQGLIEEVPTDQEQAIWRRDEGGGPLGLQLTGTGLAAIGIAPAPPPPAISRGKLGEILVLLGREPGATLDHLVALTGWLPHTTRAALCRLRQRGHRIERVMVDGHSRYRITPSTTDAVVPDHAA